MYERCFEVGVSKLGNPQSYTVASSTGGLERTILDRSLGDVTIKQWSVLRQLRQLAITW